ncbi:trehalose 6-phosphatase [Kytococcus aerolatus]|uniref:Trehalose 6-phosphate phosphatase n=1 Tax=Kytococcus aerolatus TaxID=592308 RepID=A0A212U625_9MICO|nr:trehalose-phosphatase [Kytococcus aerolatus]SNC73600.1 trehalose 6-phosphatase [Kytococcus aerolatus]
MTATQPLPRPDQSRLATAPRLVVATDFDGTLAPFRDDPLAVVPDAAAIDALRRLAALPDTHVALASGRDVETLARLSGLSPRGGVSLLGSHGGQRWWAGHAQPAGLDPDEAALREAMVRGGEALVAEHPGTHLEVKFAGVVLHSRTVTEEIEESVRQAGRRLAERLGVEPMLGKNVLELSVRRSSKGEALRELVDSLGEDPLHRPDHAERSPGWNLWFAGDDVTDETVFTEFADAPDSVLVKVGAGATAATSRVTGIPEVSALLVELADAREDALGPA